MELEIIKHSDISREDLFRVIKIKNAAWPHPIKSQLKWIEKNQSQNDFHVILKERAEDYAYMNLCPVTALVNDIEMQFMGIGNVCSKIRDKGYGGILVTLVNEYLEINNLKGMLFCKGNVMSFYAHYNWQVISSNSISIKCEGYEGIYTMCYNTPPFIQMIYNDRLF